MNKLYLNQWIFISFVFISLFSSHAYSSYELGLERLKKNDVDGAISVWTRMADNGDMNSQYSVGVLFEQQGPHLSHDLSVHYLDLASRQGMNKAQYHLAMKYFSGYGIDQDFKKTIQLLLKAAAQDYPEAQYQLGRMASEGLGFQQDATEAIRWYLLAAENGFGPAQHTLASHYMTGNGTAVNVKKAVLWLGHAADQKNMLAQRDLGFLYTQGMGVERDYARAAELLTRPAEQGSPVSRYILGQIYAEGGFGLEKSIRSAKFWFTEAIKVGYPKAEAALQQIVHLPSEPDAAEQNVEEVSVEEENELIADSEEAEDPELVGVVDPQSRELDQQYYNFYNEDLSAYRDTSRDNKSLSLENEWHYIDETKSLAEVSEDSLVEYNNIDQEFEKAFAKEARAIGGNQNYKRLFGLSADDSDYTLRKERTFVPEVSSAAEEEAEGSGKVVVFRHHSMKDQKPLGFFTRQPAAEIADERQNLRHAELIEQTAATGSKTQQTAQIPPRTIQSGTIQSRSMRRSETPVTLSQVGKFKGDGERFEKLSGDNFTLQILQSDSLVKAQQIVQKSSDQENAQLYVLPTNRNNRPMYLVTYGAYSDREKAEAAAKSLPQYVAIGTPWVRQISKIQRQIQNL